jgi:hypothetical protein
MKPPRSLRITLAIVLALVLAFALGSVGTASASGLTKGAVKRIAAKVVKKAAPTLSVAHASTADNATALNGKSAASYLNSAIVVTMPNKATATSSVTDVLPPIPAGNYVITINYAANFAAATSFSCVLSQVGVTNALVWGYAGVFNTTFGWINAPRVATVAATGALSLFCTTVGLTNFTAPFSFANPNTVTFQPLDTVTSGGTATRSDGTRTPSASGR